ncbi:hypothetical protein [Pelomonas cellulosilytica]|uniref:Uncharacterized protein n=1 Tax=Pelomonas cellulosilytica TaxID=2906762 RepID=A0ABS8XWW4_9BURK|nr:hypothetical protein [Pelomonas sp. P8]MCE4553770.1 hypothetical protein [Pelomonas sp. P8]
MQLNRLRHWLAGLLDSLPAAYRERSCQGSAWKHAFPAASNAQIRDFLGLFVRAFAFSDRHRLLFSPGDRVLDVYGHLYPKRWMPDALELETLARDLKLTHGLELQARWHSDMTLGELFAWTRESGKAIA